MINFNNIPLFLPLQGSPQIQLGGLGSSVSYPWVVHSRAHRQKHFNIFWSKETCLVATVLFLFVWRKATFDPTEPPPPIFSPRILMIPWPDWIVVEACTHDLCHWWQHVHVIWLLLHLMNFLDFHKHSSSYWYQYSVLLYGTYQILCKDVERIFNSDKICRSYCDFYFGVTFFGTHCILCH